MSAQAKDLIETSDIVALRVECEHCRAALSKPIRKHKNTFVEALQKCPNCGEPWTVFAGRSIDSVVGQFFEAVEKTGGQCWRVEKNAQGTGQGRFFAVSRAERICRDQAGAEGGVNGEDGNQNI